MIVVWLVTGKWSPRPFTTRTITVASDTPVLSSFHTSTWYRAGITGFLPHVPIQVRLIYYRGTGRFPLFTLKYLLVLTMLFFFLLGQNIILSIRIHDPKAVLSLDVIEIANLRKSLTKLKRSRIPGIYLTSLLNFPKVSRTLELNTKSI